VNRRHLVTALLVLGILALFVVPVVVHVGGSAFAGTDGQATELIERTGYTPWFHSVFSPGSAELESGLFALQAAAGAGLLGYALGRLHSRRAVREALAAAEAPRAAGSAAEEAPRP
jgi:cobalt/nickel transport protein